MACIILQKSVRVKAHSFSLLQVVQKHSRQSVYAVDKAVNVALYAVSGPLAAALASGVFGFADPPRGAAAVAAPGPAGNAAAAVALEHTLLFLLVVPRIAVVFLMVRCHPFLQMPWIALPSPAHARVQLPGVRSKSGTEAMTLGL